MSLAVWEVETRAKDRGKALAASAHYRDLQLARECAKQAFLDLRRPISADDVRAYMTRRFPDTVYGNWMGALWERGVWRQHGFCLSETPGRHRGVIRTWVMR